MGLMDLIHSFQDRFDYSTYWKRRLYIQNHNNLLKYLYIIWLRRVENSMNSSTGIGIGSEKSPCCLLLGKLNLPHRLNGIIIARNVIIGKNVTIFHNVTIAECDVSKKTIIEDNVLIGTGAVILNNVRIGKGSKLGQMLLFAQM